MSMQSLSQMSHVLSGQMQIGHGHQVLTALLGSCVGIGMIWRKQGRCGLAHCFLPEGVEAGEGSARYVSAAVPRLLAMMGVRREQYDEVDVVIAGGAIAYRLVVGYVEMEPTWLSKINTALEFTALAGLLAHAAALIDGSDWLQPLFVLVCLTVTLSGTQYVWIWSRKAAAAANSSGRP